MLIDLIKSRRSIRQFQQKSIPEKILIDCVDAARVAPSAMNLQPIEYILVTDKAQLDPVFAGLRWAAYIKPKGDPRPDQRPTAYLIVLINQSKRLKWTHHDVGAAIENFMLAALAYDIGSCWLASIDRESIRQLYKIPEDYQIDSVVALGYPAEEPVLETNNETVEYWQDEQATLHVPKYSLDTVLHMNTF